MMQCRVIIALNLVQVCDGGYGENVMKTERGGRAPSLMTVDVVGIRMGTCVIVRTELISKLAQFRLVL